MSFSCSNLALPYILGSRAPSVVGSQTGRGGGGVQAGFQPKRPNLATPPKRPGSVTGSIEGRLATSTPRGRAGERDRQFMASSPLQVKSTQYKKLVPNPLRFTY